MSNTKFDVGDTVLVFRDHRDEMPRTQTVVKIQTTYVLLDNGRKFTRDGREWGRSKEWFYSYIRPADADLLADLEAARKERATEQRRRDLRKACQSFVGELTGDELEWLYGLFRNKGMPEVG